MPPLYLLLFFLCILYASCRIPDDSCRPGDFILLQGDNQVGRKNEALAQKVKYRVVDGTGTPIPDQAIGMSVNGGGILSSAFINSRFPYKETDMSGKGSSYYIFYTQGNGIVEFDWILGKDSIQTIIPTFHNGNYCYDSTWPVASAALSPSQRGFFIDARDSFQYDTVQIGNQIWMAENLRHEYPSSNIYSDPVLAAFGRKYTWAEAKMACPIGWHLPSDMEWKTLEFYLGMTSTEVNDFGYNRGNKGVHLKAIAGWEAFTYNSTVFNGFNGNNGMGFNAYPTYSPDYNHRIGTSEYYWTATDSIYRVLSSTHNGIGRENNIYTAERFACRCVKD